MDEWHDMIIYCITDLWNTGKEIYIYTHQDNKIMQMYKNRGQNKKYVLKFIHFIRTHKGWHFFSEAGTNFSSPGWGQSHPSPPPGENCFQIVSCQSFYLNCKLDKSMDFVEILTNSDNSFKILTSCHKIEKGFWRCGLVTPHGNIEQGHCQHWLR